MAAQTWTTIQTAVVQALANAVSPSYTPTSDFNVAFPQATSYAENRIYREIIMLVERDVISSLTMTAGSRTLDITSTDMLVVEGVDLITPFGTSNPALGTCYAYDETSYDLVDLLWPQESVTVSPADAEWLGRYWAMEDPATIVIMPTPDLGYHVRLTGMVAPTPISSGNPTTYLSINYPDLLEAAIMVWMAGWLQRNYGAMSDDPKMATSWEAVYQQLKPGVIAEEARRRGLAPDRIPAPSPPIK